MGKQDEEKSKSNWKSISIYGIPGAIIGGSIAWVLVTMVTKSFRYIAKPAYIGGEWVDDIGGKWVYESHSLTVPFLIMGIGIGLLIGLGIWSKKHDATAVKVKWMAIASFVLSIIGTLMMLNMFFDVGPAVFTEELFVISYSAVIVTAILFGIVSLIIIKSSGESGRGFAIGGIMVSCISTAFMLFLIWLIMGIMQ